MRLEIVLPVLLAVLMVIVLLMTGGLLWYAVQNLGGDEGYVQKLVLFAAISALIITLLFAASWVILHLHVARPMTSLTRQMQTLTHSPADQHIRFDGNHLLGALPAAAEAMRKNYQSARRETEEAIDAATAREKKQRSQLEAILLDLSEGVIVCNLDHRILLYNHAATRILSSPGELGLGRQLFGVVTREPVIHTLEQLMHTEKVRGQGLKDSNRRFVCSTKNGGILLQARLGLAVDSKGTATGYVITFKDVSAELEDLARRDALLREVAVKWRGPLANLRAAIETIAAEPDMKRKERRAFDKVIGNEVDILNVKLHDLTGRYDRFSAGPGIMCDVHSSDLFRAVKTHLEQSEGIAATQVGVPLWLHCDSHSLMLAIEHMMRSVHREHGVAAFDLEMLLGDRYVYVEIAWKGAPIPPQVLDAWLDEPLQGTIGGRTAREIIEQHGSEIWSKDLAEGRACLRLPLGHPSRRQFMEKEKRLPPRPEFYDFDLFNTPTDTKLAHTPLRNLRYVVFDTETTGLRPSAGDELLSIGAVRIVNGRILTGETFEQLINPGRDIPESSIKFHGITEDMVRDKPPAQIVLPHFSSFVGRSVLIAHNAAFDMKFLELKENETRIRFDNAVLDVLLLSAYLHDHTPDHSLDATAERLGLEISNRHSALGDAMTTAAIFVRMLALLNARGVKTLGDAIEVSSQQVEIRKQQAKF